MSYDPRIWVSAPLPFDAASIAPTDGEAPRELILMLHGFAETRARMLKKLASAIPEELGRSALVLAPNAPFLMPHRTEQGYSATYSWYFYDPTTDEYAIDMRTSVEFLKQGLEARGLAHLPKRIIGFSQGGFLAPIAASGLENVRQFIGIGCEYLVDEIPVPIRESVPYRVDAVHGSLDESVGIDRALGSHRRLMDLGISGTFQRVEGSGHRIDDAIRAATCTLLAQAKG
jgi:predicted esterase